MSDEWIVGGIVLLRGEKVCAGPGRRGDSVVGLFVKIDLLLAF